MRQLLCYERLTDLEMVAAINALYRKLWEPVHNNLGDLSGRQDG